MPPDRGRPAVAGFSLVEVLVAITLIAVGALAAAKLQQGGAIANQGAYSREVAAALARQLLESADSLSYTDACLNDTSGSYVNPCSALSAANNLDASGAHVTTGGYQRQWSITATGGGTKTTSNYKTIRVRVRWTDRSSTQNQLDVATIKGW